MPPDWDEDSDQLQRQLSRVLASARRSPTLALARGWHREMMAGLEVLLPSWLSTPPAAFVGRFRGPPDLEVEVQVGGHPGVPALEVERELERFITTLSAAIERLDALVPPGMLPTEETLPAVVDLCGWVHAQWIRIHPFGNGNGRTARLWANWVAMRYGLPPFIRLRPRPGDLYGRAGRAAMQGRWRPTADCFRAMLDEFS